MNILITGANRGLGQGFAEHYLKAGHHVWGCYRSTPGGLTGLKSDRLRTLQWDVREPKPRGGEELPEHIDLLINNAGIYGPAGNGQSLEKITPDIMQDVFDVDCIGPLRVVRYLLPRIISTRGIIVNLSSKMGSSGDNTSGGSYAYRAAKAALVIVSRSMAIDLAPQGVRVITLHPGWVRTDMTSHSGLIDVGESVAGMTRVIESINNYEPGAFVAFDGKIVPY